MSEPIPEDFSGADGCIAVLMLFMGFASVLIVYFVTFCSGPTPTKNIETIEKPSVTVVDNIK